MTSDALKSSGFSFKRLWAFAAYYIPRLKGELLVYTAISIVCSVLCLLPANEDVQIASFVGTWTILPIIFYCSPLIFAKGPDTRILDRLLPVSAAEKITFYYIYILMVIPVVVYLLPICAGLIYISCPALQTPGVMGLYETKFSSVGFIWLINLIGGIFIALACFFSVEYARQNRMLWGIVAVIVANTIIGIFGAIIGMVAALKGFRTGLMDGLAGNEPNCEKATEEIVTSVLNEINTAHPVSLAMTGMIIVLIGLTVWLTYRTIRKRNL